MWVKFKQKSEKKKQFTIFTYELNAIRNYTAINRQDVQLIIDYVVGSLIFADISMYPFIHTLKLCAKEQLWFDVTVILGGIKQKPETKLKKQIV